MSEFSAATVSDEWAKLDPRDILTDASEKVAAAIRALVPSPVDMNAELRCEVHRLVEGVEFMPLKALRWLCLAVDPACSYHRTKQYGQVALDWELVEDLRDGAALDEVRRRCFTMARMFAARIAEQALALRRNHPWMPPRGASVEYTSALCIPPKDITVTVRARPNALPRAMPHGHSDDIPRVLSSHYTDEVILRYAADYVIAPEGEEFDPDVD